jgi:hypothetical protein
LELGTWDLEFPTKSAALPPGYLFYRSHDAENTYNFAAPAQRSNVDADKGKSRDVISVSEHEGDFMGLSLNGLLTLEQLPQNLREWVERYLKTHACGRSHAAASSIHQGARYLDSGSTVESPGNKQTLRRGQNSSGRAKKVR